MTESLLPEADNILYRPTLRDSLLYKPTLSDRYGLRPFTAIERLDLERTERALQRSKSMEKLELDHLRALQKSRELAKLEQELETKRRERLAREQLEDVIIICAFQSFKKNASKTACLFPLQIHVTLLMKKCQ